MAKMPSGALSLSDVLVQEGISTGSVGRTFLSDREFSTSRVELALSLSKGLTFLSDKTEKDDYGGTGVLARAISLNTVCAGSIYHAFSM